MAGGPDIAFKASSLGSSPRPGASGSLTMSFAGPRPGRSSRAAPLGLSYPTSTTMFPTTSPLSWASWAEAKSARG